MHDFRSKLSDPRVGAIVEGYLRRARRRRGSSSGEAPADGDRHGPVSINLDLTMACDYRCAHCIDGELLNGGRKFARETVLGTLDVLAHRGLRSVILIGGGEPTLYPFFEEVVEAIKRLDLECAIVSNGAHNDRIGRVASHLGPKDWVRLSLDAGTDATFQALHAPRRPIALEEICRSAGEFKAQAPQLQLGFSFIAMWNSPGQRFRPVAGNVREMPAAARLAKEHGFDYISFKPMLVRSAERGEIVNVGQPHRSLPGIHEIRDSLRAAQSMADSRFKVVPSRNLMALLDGSALERSALQPVECHMQQFRQVLTPDGIFACPAHRGNAGSRVTDSAGYATPTAFQETAQATELQMRRFDASVQCREITCIYNDVNWWLEDLIESGEPLQHTAAGDFFL
jgi:hypothetical protein